MIFAPVLLLPLLALNQYLEWPTFNLGGTIVNYCVQDQIFEPILSSYKTKVPQLKWPGTGIDYPAMP
jgi:hypothetical protein